jgi:hypothetical protein
LHAIETWLPAPSAAAAFQANEGTDYKYVDLDAWPTDPAQTIKVVHRHAIHHQEPPVLCLLRFGRLWAQGFSVSAATATSRVPVASRDAFMQVLATAAKRQGAHDNAVPLETIRPLHLAHWEGLITSFESVLGRTSVQPSELDLTLGRRHQIILFEEDHFSSFRDFMGDLKLDKSDTVIVKSPNLDKDVEDWLEHAGLKKFVVPRETLGLTFQLDTTMSRRPRQPVTHRVAVTRASESKKLVNNLGLKVMWVAWNAAAAALGGGGRQLP